MDARIAVASPNLGTGFTGLMYSHLRKHLRPGQSVIECEIVLRDDPEYQRYHLLRLLEENPRPMVLVGICVQPDLETIAAFRAAGLPVVLVDEEQEGASTISSDNFVGGYLAGQHLAKAGRRSLAVVSGRMHINGGYNALQRVRGFGKALAEQGVRFQEREVIEVADYSRKDGLRALGEILQARRDVDGVFCAAGDLCATGILATAREKRLDVPGRLAVVGYDDHKLASVSNPPLSTIRQPMEQIAAEALRLATQETREILSRPKKVLLEPMLVQRFTA
jgi:DNA-binding LacI/PurR family transcriptional regulator